MTTKTKIITTLAVATVLAIGAAAGVAHTVNEKRAQFPLALVSKVTHLGITDAQTGKIRAVLQKQRPTLEPLIKQCVAERRALRDTIRCAKVDEAAIRAQASRVAKVETDLAVKRAHVFQEVRSVLTPEQVGKLKEIRAYVDARMDEVIDRIGKRLSEG